MSKKKQAKTAVLMLAMDVGFSKTGTALFEIGVEQDILIRAETFMNELDKSIGSVVHQDYLASATLFQKLLKYALGSHISGLIAELPGGGAQGARANRCMGIATGMFASLTCILGSTPFEFYSPNQVERALGIELKAGDAKGMKKGMKTKWKKARMRSTVLEEFHQFDEWPRTVELAEDSYDAAAAFMASRLMGENSLYWRLKRRVIEDSRVQPLLPFEKGAEDGPEAG